MATVENTTVKVYKGVPLIKGGTEVLYLSQAAAESALSSFLFKTYTKFYYQRENRGYIQIEETIDELEGANYVSFINNSHGSKIYFAFIDRLVYINDEVTQVEYTIDPFPTYLADTVEKYPVYVLRNTLLDQATAAHVTPDFMPEELSPRYGTLATKSYQCWSGVCYFVSQHTLGANLVDLNGNPTGVQLGALTSAAIESIQQDNGVIIGAYLLPSELLGATYPISKNLTGMLGQPFNVFPDIQNAANAKLRSGVYNEIVLRTTQGVRSYELEGFTNPDSISFGCVGLLAPSPSIYIYPQNYKGQAQNLSEGLLMQCPALPIATNATYTNQQAFNDIAGLIGGVGAGVLSGFLGGGVGGAVLGGGINLLSGLTSVAKNQINTKMQTPRVASNGSPVLSVSGTLDAVLQVVVPSYDNVNRIDRYLSYYGYNVSGEYDLAQQVNLNDGAYLQTGSEYLYGSEADIELNARLAAGIKIRKTLV